MCFSQGDFCTQESDILEQFFEDKALNHLFSEIKLAAVRVELGEAGPKPTALSITPCGCVAFNQKIPNLLNKIEY